MYGLDFTDDNLKKVEEKLHTEQFEREVQNCILAMEAGRRSVPQQTYDPFVITEVHKRVFDSMLQESRRYTQRLKDSLISLSESDFRHESQTSKQLSQILDDLNSAPQPEDVIHYIPKNTYKKNHIEKVFRSAEDKLLASLDAKSRELVGRCLETYEETRAMKRRERGTETLISNSKIEKDIENEVLKRTKEVKTTFQEQILLLKSDVTKLERQLEKRTKEWQAASIQGDSLISELKNMNSTLSKTEKELNQALFKLQEKENYADYLKEKLKKADEKKETIGGAALGLRLLANHMMTLYSKMMNKAGDSFQQQDQIEDDLNLYNLLHKDVSLLDEKVNELCGNLSLSQSKVESETRQELIERFEETVLDESVIKARAEERGKEDRQKLEEDGRRKALESLKKEQDMMMGGMKNRRARRSNILKDGDARESREKFLKKIQKNSLLKENLKNKVVEKEIKEISEESQTSENESKADTERIKLDLGKNLEEYSEHENSKRKSSKRKKKLKSNRDEKSSNRKKGKKKNEGKKSDRKKFEERNNISKENEKGIVKQSKVTLSPILKNENFEVETAEVKKKLLAQRELGNSFELDFEKDGSFQTKKNALKLEKLKMLEEASEKNSQSQPLLKLDKKNQTQTGGTPGLRLARPQPSLFINKRKNSSGDYELDRRLEGIIKREDPDRKEKKIIIASKEEEPSILDNIALLIEIKKDIHRSTLPNRTKKKMIDIIKFLVSGDYSGKVADYKLGRHGSLPQSPSKPSTQQFDSQENRRVNHISYFRGSAQGQSQSTQLQSWNGSVHSTDRRPGHRRYKSSNEAEQFFAGNVPDRVESLLGLLQSKIEQEVKPRAGSRGFREEYEEEKYKPVYRTSTNWKNVVKGNSKNMVGYKDWDNECNKFSKNQKFSSQQLFYKPRSSTGYLVGNNLSSKLLKNQELLKKEFNPLSEQNRTDPQYHEQLLQFFQKKTKISALPGVSGKSYFKPAQILQIKKEVKVFVSDHEKCGPSCPHLFRFFKRVANLANRKGNKNRKEISLSKIDINEGAKCERSLNNEKKRRIMKTFNIVYKS